MQRAVQCGAVRYMEEEEEEEEGRKTGRKAIIQTDERTDEQIDINTDRCASLGGQEDVEKRTDKRSLLREFFFFFCQPVWYV